MAKAQIIAVTTAQVGPAGPVRRYYAVALDADLALLEIEKKLKGSEVANWVDTRSLTMLPGEIRPL